jgi:hypothetical protein
MKKTLFWILSFVITLLFAMFQRVTGPTYPAKGIVEFSDIKLTAQYKYPRSCTTATQDCRVKVETREGFKITASPPWLRWRRYKTDVSWSDLPFVSRGFVAPGSEKWEAILPDQPPAGKLEYFVIVKNPSGERQLGNGTVITRFKGNVPAWALIPHIILMFLFLLLSVRIFLSVFSSGFAVRHAIVLNLLFLLLGGFLFGPLVQYYAFGRFWTGFPFGYDLTDNKTLLMLLAWLPALYLVLKARSCRAWVALAFVVTFAVYLVPHSLFGSELDYSKDQIVTGR